MDTYEIHCECWLKHSRKREITDIFPAGPHPAWFPLAGVHVHVTTIPWVVTGPDPLVGVHVLVRTRDGRDLYIPHNPRDHHESAISVVCREPSARLRQWPMVWEARRRGLGFDKTRPSRAWAAGAL